MKLKTTVSQLLPGDKLPFNRTILGVFHQGLHIPSGKSEILIQNSRGEKRVAQWNKTTTMTVERECNDDIRRLS